MPLLIYRTQCGKSANGVVKLKDSNGIHANFLSTRFHNFIGNLRSIYRFAYGSRSRCRPFSRSRSVTTCHFLLSLASPTYIRIHDILGLLCAKRNLRPNEFTSDSMLIRCTTRATKGLPERGVRVITRS